MASHEEDDSVAVVVDIQYPLTQHLAAEGSIPIDFEVKLVLCNRTQQILFMEASRKFMDWMVQKLVVESYPVIPCSAQYDTDHYTYPLFSEQRIVLLHAIVKDNMKASLRRMPRWALTGRGRELRRHLFSAQPEEWRVARVATTEPDYVCLNFNAQPGAGCGFHCTLADATCPRCDLPMQRLWPGRRVPTPLPPPVEMDYMRWPSSDGNRFFGSSSTLIVTDDLFFAMPVTRQEREGVLERILRAKGIRDPSGERFLVCNRSVRREEIDRMLESAYGNSRNVLSEMFGSVQNVRDSFNGAVMLQED